MRYFFLFVMCLVINNTFAQLKVDLNGNVGINGKPHPTYPLKINGPTYITGFLRTGSNFYVWGSGFSVNSGFKINSDGFVGIGTDPSSSCALNVGGSINTTSDINTTSYVQSHSLYTSHIYGMYNSTAISKYIDLGADDSEPTLTVCDLNTRGVALEIKGYVYHTGSTFNTSD